MTTATRKYNSDLRNGRIIVSHNKKWCPSCKVIKKKKEFAKNKSNSGGLSGHCKSCKVKQQLKYQKNNSERVNKYQRDYYHTGKGKKYHQEKVRNNPELYRMLGRNKSQTRRARVLDAFVEVIDSQIVFERDEGICGICLDPVLYSEGWEVDHIIPLALGGKHEYENVQLAHLSCNRVKSDRPVRILSDGDWEFDY